MWFNPFVYQCFTNVEGKQLHVKKKIYNTLFRYKLMCIFAQTLKQKDNDLTTT